MGLRPDIRPSLAAGGPHPPPPRQTRQAPAPTVTRVRRGPLAPGAVPTYYRPVSAVPCPISDWPPTAKPIVNIPDILHNHQQVIASGLHNFQGPRLPVPTRLHMSNWYHLLGSHGYVDYQLCDLLQYGFPINYTKGEPPSVPITNHRSALAHASHIDNYLLKETSKGAIIGPFTSNPLCSHLTVSPLQTVPKKGSNDRRIVLDLSYPHSSSVNDGIPKDTYLGDPVDLRYPSIDNLVDLILKFGVGAKLFKCDLSRCYKQMYIDPADIAYTGMFWRGDLYIELVFPFGVRSAALNCQRMTTAVTFLYEQLYDYLAVNYLDDFGSCNTPDKADDAYHKLLHLIQHVLGLQVNPEKCSPPSTCMVFLGIEADSVAMELRIPQDKLSEARELLEVWLTKEFCTRHALQSLLGTLMHLVKVIRPGRRFVARIIEQIKAQEFPLELDYEFRLDIHWWHEFMAQYNSVSLIQNATWSLPDQVLSSDACLQACGAYFDGQYHHTIFPPDITAQGLDINCLELLALVVSVKLWASDLQRQRIVVAVDNASVSHAVSSGKSHSRFMQKLLRELWFLEANYSCSVKAIWIPGVDNKLADHLSRWHMSPYHQQQFQLLTSGIRTRPCTVTTDLFEFNVQPH